MAAKLRAAAAARHNPDTFLIARTDARAVHGLDEALRRAELYLAAGADGVFVEAPQTLDELARIGRAFRGVPQLANMLEGGRTPILPASELFRLGFAMIAYPTSLIFRVARTIEKALRSSRPAWPALDSEGRRLRDLQGHDGVAHWAGVEQRFTEAPKSLIIPHGRQAREDAVGRWLSAATDRPRGSGAARERPGRQA